MLEDPTLVLINVSYVNRAKYGDRNGVPMMDEKNKITNKSSFLNFKYEFQIFFKHIIN